MKKVEPFSIGADPMKNHPSRLHGILILAFAVLLIFTKIAVAREGTAKRNIVFILVDDQRYDALGMMGHPYLETPHLDNLAANGVFFENAFVTTSLCSPSRASILSGQYAHKHGVLDNSTPLPPDTPTFPKALQSAGYRTGFVGKWHMGGTSDEPRSGFDRWVSFRGQGVYNDPVFNVDGNKVDHKGGYVTDLITDYSVDFLDSAGEEPFLLYVSHKAVHAEFIPAERHAGSYKDVEHPFPDSMADTEENYQGKPDWVRAQRESWHGVDGMYNGQTDFNKFVRDYAETMRAVDDSVGRIVEKLQEEGLLESTLLVYTSDNGFLFGEHGHIDKRSMYEESIRVPLIVHCPELVPAAERRPEMILNIDFAPTFMQAAGVEIPDSVQGRSFYPLVTGGENDPWRDSFLYEYFWERSFPQTPTVLGVRTDTHKLMRFHGIWDKYEMYNLREDPKEMNNLLGDFMVGHESGTLDNLIRRTAQGETKEKFVELSEKLDKLLTEMGCADEPSW
jgi:N-acetylglucosamine-6-sulfatase